MRKLASFVTLVALGCSVPACSRSGAPNGAAVATPAINVIHPMEFRDNEPEGLGDDEFRPAPAPRQPILLEDHGALGKSRVALPVVTTLTGENGETRIRLLGVVGINALTTMLKQQGQLQVTLLETGDLRLLAIKQDQLTVADGDRKEVLDVAEILQRKGFIGLHGSPLDLPPMPIPSPEAPRFTPLQPEIIPSATPNIHGANPTGIVNATPLSNAPPSFEPTSAPAQTPKNQPVN